MVARLLAHVHGLWQDRIIRNISWLSLSYLFAKPLWFAFITAGCMRLLSPDGYGVFTTSLVLAMLASAIGDLGTTEYTTREVAREAARGPRLLTNILLARIGLAFVGVLVALAIGMALGYPPHHLAAVVAAGMYAVAFRGAEYCRAFYRAFEKLRHEAIFTVIEKVVVVALGLAALAWYRSPAMAFLGMGVGMATVFGANVWWVDRRFAAFDVRLVRPAFMLGVIRSAAPIGLIALLGVVPLTGGPLIIESLMSVEDAGLYGAAQRILEAMMLLTTVVVVSLFPRLSALFHIGSLTEFGRLLRHYVGAVTLLTFAVAGATSLLAHEVIALLAGDDAFGPAGSVLAAFVWVFPLMSATFLSVTALVAANAHRFAAATTGGAALMSILLMLILVPPLGLYGPVVALAVTNLCLATANLIGCWRLTSAARAGTDRP